MAYHRIKRWAYPESYIGKDFSDYYMGLSQSRDSNALERANFKALLELLGGEHEPHVIISHANHWAVGWVEQILVHKNAKKKLDVLERAAADIEVHPVLDETSLNEEEDEDLENEWEAWGYEEAVRFLEKNLPGFESFDSDVMRDFLRSAFWDLFSYYGENVGLGSWERLAIAIEQMGRDPAHEDIVEAIRKAMPKKRKLTLVKNPKQTRSFHLNRHHKS